MSMLSRRDLLRMGAAATASTSTLLAFDQIAMAADPYDDVPLVAGEPPQPEKGAFTVVVLPDTQLYSEKYPQQFLAQTRWIAEQVDRRNIACVLHLGDLTNRNTTAEWENAQEAMTQLDGIVPYFMATGNHDYSIGGTCEDRSTQFNKYFPVKKYSQSKNFGGVYDREPTRFDNSYHFFSAGGRDFLVLSLEFGPRADVVRWANEVVSEHKEREAILITHAYMYSDETRYDWEKHGFEQSWNPHSYGVAKSSNHDVHDGEELWRELVGRNDNFIMTLNGHVLNDGLALLTSSTATGQEVHQMLVNFQMKPQGGDGWLRLLEFSADGAKVNVADYSPTLDKRNQSAANTFSLPL